MMSIFSLDKCLSLEFPFDSIYKTHDYEIKFNYIVKMHVLQSNQF